MNEMTPQECAERLKNIAIMTPDVELVKYAASILSGELVEVKHARWVFDSDGYVRCSVCNQKAPVFLIYQDEPETRMSKYCPSCGYLMDADTGNPATGKDGDEG